MRFLLRNAIRDARLEARRRRNMKLINRRPVIGGKPLPPGGTKFLRVHDLNPALLDEIEHHHNAGNVQLLMQGRGGGEVDFAWLRAHLGWESPAPVEKPEPVAEEVAPPAPEPEPEAAPEPVFDPVPADEPISAESSAPELPEETEPMDVDALLDPEDPPEVEHEEHRYTKSELSSLKNDDLRTILTKLGGKPVNKSKSKLVTAILEAQESGGEE